MITVSGGEIEDGTILIEKGRITAVGKDVKVPWNARVHRLPRGVAMPGLIAVHTQAGLRVPNENVPSAPYISVLDGLDPSTPGVKNALRDGITAMNVMPGSTARVAGRGAVVRTTGRTVEEMVIVPDSAMKVSLRTGPTETRMQTIAALRRQFLDAYFHVKDLLAEASPPGALASKPATRPELSVFVEARAAWAEIAWDRVPLDKVDPQTAPLLDVVRGKLRAFIYCPSAADVFKAFELIDSNGLKATLVLGRDAYKLADVLKARKDLGPVVVDGELVVWDSDPETGEERRHVTPRVLSDAGITFAVQADSDGEPGARFSRDGAAHLWYQAALLVRHGIPRAEALRTITLTPARILGLDHRMGTIEPGKDGNVAVFSGDPLDARSWVELVVIEGKEAYRREKDRDLELLNRDPEKRF